MMDMANRLQEARKQAGYSSARGAAIKLGWSYTTYAGHENASRGFEKQAQKYAQVFGVSLEWLLTGRGAMKRGSASAEIVDIWDRIPDHHRDTAREMLEGLTKKDSL